MSSLLRGRPAPVRRTLLVLALIGMAGGCADIITYSKASQEKGETLLAQGRYDEAAGAFREAVKQNPRNYTSFYDLGVCYQQLGREQQALQSFHAALDVMPTDLPASDTATRAFRETAVDGLANCIAKSASKDQEIQAMVDKTQHADIAHKPMAWYALAKTYAAAGDADNATQAYDQAYVSSDRHDEGIARSYGLYLAQTSQTRTAIPVLTTAYRLNPADAQVNAALRQLGIVPGPSLLDPSQLHSPIIPKGPLPGMR